MSGDRGTLELGPYLAPRTVEGWRAVLLGRGMAASRGAETRRQRERAR